MTIQDILRRHGQAESQMDMWKTGWQDLSDFISPRISNIQQRRSPGALQTERLFDSTAPHANELLGASMQGNLTSGSQRWFGASARGIKLDMDHEWSIWFEDCSNRMYDEFNQSNAASEFHEKYLNLGAIGTGAMMFGERTVHGKWGGFMFRTLAPGTYAIDENEEGRVDTLYRKYSMSYSAAEKAFDGNLSPTMKAKLSNNPYDMGIFLHAVLPRDVDYIHPMQKVVSQKKMPWASYWIDMESKYLNKEAGYREFPFMVSRWLKNSEEKYGRGPGYTALPTVKTLNKLVELELRALAKMIDPPVKVRDEGVLGTVRLTPGGLTHVRDMESVQVLELGGRFDVSKEQKEEMRSAIRRIFFTDQLQLQEGPQMTAYEVQVRYELMQKILGPTLGRLEVEFLNPLIERAFWMMFRKNLFLPMPKSLAKYIRDHDMALDIEYEGPLARAQRLQESVAVQRFFQIALPVAERNPEVLDNVDMDEVIRLHARSVGVPERIMKDPKVVAKTRQERAKAQAEQRQQEQMMATAKAAGSSAPALKALTEANKQGIIPASGAVVAQQQAA